MDSVVRHGVMSHDGSGSGPLTQTLPDILIKVWTSNAWWMMENQWIG